MKSPFFFLILILASKLPICAAAAAATPAPRVVGEWWQIASTPDLGELSVKGQQVVDFGIWQAADKTWQVWSCIRNTKEAGQTRVFHRWEGAKLFDTAWQPKGIAMRADPAVGETAGGLQAPYVICEGGRFVMFYGDWVNICSQESTDGKEFRRILDANGKSKLFGGDFESNTRDPMLFRLGDEWICYYTANPAAKGSVYARKSRDLRHWGEEILVAEAGLNPKNLRFAAECPFVVEPRPGEYYLFETQVYGRDAHTTVRYSRDPLNFKGADAVVGTLPIAAPEIFRFEGVWYIAALRGLQGIQIARIAWD